MRLVLHIGAHGTDGGLIAGWIARNRDALAAQGIAAPPPRLFLQRLSAALDEGRDAEPLAREEALLRGLGASGQRLRMVVSAPGLLGSAADVLSPEGFYVRDVARRLYGLGSLFPQFPAIRQSELWPYLRQAWPYALLALSLSYAGYEGEVMRGAFASVPRGQLEAARAYGFSRRAVFRRIWLPQALARALPTLGGETVLQLKATPLVATITVIDIYAVASRVRQDTFIIYEPLILLALIYMAIAGVIALGFRWLEARYTRGLGH